MSEIPDHDDDQAPFPHANQVQQPPSTALQQQSEQAVIDLEEELQEGAQVVDWSAETSDDDDELSNPSSSTMAPLDLHQAEHLSVSKIELTPVTLQEAGNRLDNLLASIPLQESTADLHFQELKGLTAKLPSITIHPTSGSSAPSSVNRQPVMSTSAANLATVSNLNPEISTDQAEETPLSTQASLPLPIATSMIPDSVGSPRRKRQNESTISGESSPLNPSVIPCTNWPVSSPTSNPFLEQDVVFAFSSTTQIKDMSRNVEKAAKPKKKKLIKKM